MKYKKFLSLKCFLFNHGRRTNLHISYFKVAAHREPQNFSGLFILTVLDLQTSYFSCSECTFLEIVQLLPETLFNISKKKKKMIFLKSKYSWHKITKLTKILITCLKIFSLNFKKNLSFLFRPYSLHIKLRILVVKFFVNIYIKYIKIWIKYYGFFLLRILNLLFFHFHLRHNNQFMNTAEMAFLKKNIIRIIFYFLSFFQSCPLSISENIKTIHNFGLTKEHIMHIY